MKIHGLSSLKYKIPVQLQFGDKSLLLELSPMPYNFLSRLGRELPDPEPPRAGFLKDGKGRVQYGDNGKPIIEYNQSDPAYLAAVSKINDLQSVAMIYEAVKDCPEVSFETKREGRTPQEFYAAIGQELEDACFTVGMMGKIINAIKEDMINVATKERDLSDEKKSS